MTSIIQLVKDLILKSASSAMLSNYLLFTASLDLIKRLRKLIIVISLFLLFLPVHSLGLIVNSLIYMNRVPDFPDIAVM